MGHALAGCRDNELMRTARHHKAGRIYRPLSENGEHGGCIASADVGSATACAQDGITHQPTFKVAVRAHRLLTDSKVESLRATKHWSVPDILMVVPPRRLRARQQSTWWNSNTHATTRRNRRRTRQNNSTLSS